MLQKLKNFFGGRKNAAQVVRDIICARESQSILFEPGYEQALKAYVMYGHELSSENFIRFLQVSNKKIITTYLEMGFVLEDKQIQAVLDLKDEELARTMIKAGSWAPFPYGNCTHRPVVKHHDALHEHHDEFGEHEETDGAGGHLVVTV